MTRTIALVFVLVTPSLIPAAVPVYFTGYRTYLLSGTPNALAIADVNHDGIPDVIAGTGGGIDVLLGRGDGYLARPMVAGGSVASVFSIAVADFNNDGNLDIAAVHIANGSYLTLLLGNGDGTFQAPQTLPIDCVDFSCTIAAADFNGDGNMDLAVARTDRVAIFLGNGAGAFQRGAREYGTQYAVAIAAGDLNQDGKPDLVVSDTITRKISVLLGNGDGTFKRRDYDNGYTPYGVALADFNADGKLDLAVAGGLSGHISVRLNQGNGILGAPTSYASHCPNCNLQSIAAGDFNQDGNVDIATPATVLHGSGDGTLQSPVFFSSGQAPNVVASGDLNHDGFTDLVVGDSTSTDIAVLLGDARSFREPRQSHAGYRPRALVSADFNRDGKPDVAVAVNGENVVRILLGQGDGSFIASEFPVQGAGALVAADFNGDGNIDLAVSEETGTSIFIGNGDGTFTPGSQYAGFYGDCTDNQWPAHTCFAVADFNGDGIPDLAGALWIQNEIFFLLGNGDGTFRPGPTIHLNDSPQGLAVGDFNHDGKTDVAVSGYGGTIFVLAGNGDGTFGTPLTRKMRAGGIAGISAGDIDGDGNLDLVVAGGGGGSLISLGVYILRGNGDLTFEAPVPLIADEMPNWVQLVDLNGDGQLDIVAADVMADNLAVWVNSGNMKFTHAVLYGTGLSPAMVVAADLNGDGLPDLVSVNQESGDLSIFLQAPGSPAKPIEW